MKAKLLDSFIAARDLFVLWCVAMTGALIFDEVTMDRKAQRERNAYYAEIVANCLNGRNQLIGSTILMCDASEVVNPDRNRTQLARSKP